VLVEDTLEHQKAARAEGWRTVWMQRWMKASPGATTAVSRDLHRRPAYVHRRVRSLAAL
jgi:putative hydrolase of the HAD superfamily